MLHNRACEGLILKRSEWSWSIDYGCTALEWSAEGAVFSVGHWAQSALVFLVTDAWLTYVIIELHKAVIADTEIRMFLKGLPHKYVSNRMESSHFELWIEIKALKSLFHGIALYGLTGCNDVSKSNASASTLPGWRAHEGKKRAVHQFNFSFALPLWGQRGESL